MSLHSRIVKVANSSQKLFLSAPEAEKVLLKYLESEKVFSLGIGKIIDFSLIHQFERKFSSFFVYRLNGVNGAKEIYIKIFKNYFQIDDHKFQEKINIEFETYSFWYDKFSSLEGFSTFRPLFSSPEDYALITEGVSGENLAFLVERKARYFVDPNAIEELTKHMARAGELLKHFQAFYAKDEQFDLQLLIQDVNERLDKVLSNPRSLFSGKDRDDILNFYQKNLSRANKGKNRLTYIHSDYNLANLLVNQQEMIIHDFVGINLGHYLHDLTRFYHQLELFKYKPIHPPGIINKLQEAFLKGYGYTGSIDDLIFRFFMIRHYLTHTIGIARFDEKSPIAKLYNLWVIMNHKRKIKQLIRR